MDSIYDSTSKFKEKYPNYIKSDKNKQEYEKILGCVQQTELGRVGTISVEGLCSRAGGAFAASVAASAAAGAIRGRHDCDCNFAAAVALPSTAVDLL